MGGVSHGNYVEQNRNYGNDFIPVVELDLLQEGIYSKNWIYDGFKILDAKNKITLDKNLDSTNRIQKLYNIKLKKEEVVVRFIVKQGNSAATDNDGYIEIKPNGVEVITKKKISIKYGKFIALRLSTKNLKENAYIDFYASDEEGTFDKMGLSNIHCGRVLITQQLTCLVLYGSGWVSPSEGDHHAGDSFKFIAEARNKINKNRFKSADCKTFYTPSDLEFFQKINQSEGIIRLDIYCHAWQVGLNLGGFKGKRNISGGIYNGDNIDWSEKSQGGGADLRRVDSEEDSYYRSSQPNELLQIKKEVFNHRCEIYLWGCNAGGQLTPKGIHVASNDPYISDPKRTFAQILAKHIGIGNVFALVGKGKEAGSMFKQDSEGKNVLDDGEMIPANISANYNYRNTKSLNAMNYMKKFPL